MIVMNSTVASVAVRERLQQPTRNTRRPQLAAPWYVHPADNQDAWSRLTRGTSLRFAVVNAANGPKVNEPYYREVLKHGSATPLVGYVNVDYGKRPASLVLQDARQWLSQPGVQGIMFDCVPSSTQHRHWDLNVIKTVRRLGARTVVTNPGTIPDPKLIETADVTCVAEMDWSAFQKWQTCNDLCGLDAQKQWALIYNVPETDQEIALERIRKNRIGNGWVTAGQLPNPWATLPTRWDK